MWGIISLVLLILVITTESLELKLGFLIAAAIFAVANEIAGIGFKLKRIFGLDIKESKDEN
jgi:hypothetical protein